MKRKASAPVAVSAVSAIAARKAQKSATTQRADGPVRSAQPATTQPVAQRKPEAPSLVDRIAANKGPLKPSENARQPQKPTVRKAIGQTVRRPQKFEQPDTDSSFGSSSSSDEDGILVAAGTASGLGVGGNAPLNNNNNNNSDDDDDDYDYQQQRESKLGSEEPESESDPESSVAQSPPPTSAAATAATAKDKDKDVPLICTPHLLATHHALSSTSTGTAVTLRLPPRASVAPVGAYTLWVKRGVVSVWGAKLRAGPRAVVRVAAPATHALPVVRGVVGDRGGAGGKIEIEVRTVEDGEDGVGGGMDWERLGTLSPLFRRIGAAGGGEGEGRSFAILPSAATDPYRRPLRPLHLHRKWSAALATLAARGPGLRVLTVGPKGAGKSTFNKFLVNHLLTPVPAEAGAAADGGEGDDDGDGDGDGVGGDGFAGDGVAVLDLDPGQSEFLPGGHVCLAHVRAPILGPSYAYGWAAAKSSANDDDDDEDDGDDDGDDDDASSNSKSPFGIVRAHFLGAASPKDDPALYLAAAADLVRTYHTLRAERFPDCPLIVNYPGWIFGLGLEMATTLIGRGERLGSSKNGPRLGLTDVVYLSERGPAEVVEGLTAAAGGAGVPLMTLPSHGQGETGEGDGGGGGGGSAMRSGAELRVMQLMAYFHGKERSSAEDQTEDEDSDSETQSEGGGGGSIGAESRSGVGAGPDGSNGSCGDSHPCSRRGSTVATPLSWTAPVQLSYALANGCRRGHGAGPGRGREPRIDSTGADFGPDANNPLVPPARARSSNAREAAIPIAGVLVAGSRPAAALVPELLLGSVVGLVAVDRRQVRPASGKLGVDNDEDDGDGWDPPVKQGLPYLTIASGPDGSRRQVRAWHGDDGSDREHGEGDENGNRNDSDARSDASSESSPNGSDDSGRLPAPARSQSLGLALVRAIDADAQTVEASTPVAVAAMRRMAGMSPRMRPAGRDEDEDKDAGGDGDEDSPGSGGGARSPDTVLVLVRGRSEAAHWAMAEDYHAARAAARRQRRAHERQRDRRRAQA